MPVTVVLEVPSLSMAPMFSVFIPARNEADWLPGAIASVQGQTFQDWELVIGDNASTDDTAAIAERFGLPVRGHRWPNASDVFENFNRTAGLCGGAWLIPMGADDRLLPNALETFARSIEQGGAPVMVVGECARIDVDGQPAAATWRFYQRLSSIAQGDYDATSWMRVITREGQPPWNIGSIAFSREATYRAGGLFDPSAGPACDIELAMRMAAVGPVRYVRRRVLIYTQRSNSDQRARQRAERVEDSEQTILERGLRVGLAAHVRLRGSVTEHERDWIADAIAMSHLQRAAQHRLLHGGQGRRGAWRDVRRAWRARRRSVLTPRHLLVAGAALIAPRWALRAANRLLRVDRS